MVERAVDSNFVSDEPVSIELYVAQSKSVSVKLSAVESNSVLINCLQLSQN